MKITFSNLGTIKKTELDLRPLTVIIGPNNTSKTYVAYSVYGLWKAFRENSGLGQVYIEPKRTKGALSYIGDERLSRSVEKLLTNVVTGFKAGLGSYFQDTSERLFSGTSFRITVEPSEALLAAKEAAGFLVSKGFSVAVFDDRIEFDTSKLTQGDKLFLAASLPFHLLDSLFPQPYLMPAERNAFIITYKMLATRRFRVLREAQRAIVQRQRLNQRQIELMREQGDIRYPTPIEDFLDFLTDVELSHHANGNRKERSIAAVARLIEENIQNKHATRFVATSLGGHEIKVDINKDLSIDLYNASSSIKQLAPLLLYLRHRAQPNDLLIIDEPEMNLHPESQAKLLEALGILVNLGVHVLLTTHSPYFMAHLNNIVGGNMKSPRVRKKQAEALYLGDERAFLPMDKVSAYEMKDGKLCSLKDEDFGIRWDTLSDVSADIQQRFFTIQEAGRKKHGKGQ
ncbi:MAG: ATP-binding protein [Polyangiaceae bacterium]|nr:ATP-binding protein [Polyangiaceae bacterium]